jgi:hypothetical protein
MSTIDIDAIECTQVSYAGLNFVKVKDKLNMAKISQIISKPILRYGKEYFILDIGVCYHYFQA